MILESYSVDLVFSGMMSLQYYHQSPPLFGTLPPSALLNAQLISVGSSSSCSENAGAAGTLYDPVPRSLIVDNYNISRIT